MQNAPTKASTDDRWIPSACSMCYGKCSIRGHVVDGVLVKIEGNPDSPIGSGRLCAKGTSGLMMLYDPNRLNRPLKRTNPEKGIGIDPKWVEVSWDEALHIVCEKLKKCYEEDPRAVVLQGTTTCAFTMLWGNIVFGTAFGTPNRFSAGGGVHCGNGSHQVDGIMHASWSIVPDFELCNYALYFGASKGHAAGHVANQSAQLAAEARARGMKLVVVDPMCNFASAKATEWVPIRVGTDAAMALSMSNVLVNELDLYDRVYLKKCTNAPYLIRPDGHYLRDENTGKPLVWDTEACLAKTFDDETVRDFALEGAYKVGGSAVQPAFQILKLHLKKYSPEYASEITTVPKDTIRRLAREFGEAARIGSTIVVDGVEIPYRPAAAVFFRGSNGHKNATWNCVSVDLLNHLCGTADTAGGCLGFNPVCHGYPGTGRLAYKPSSDPDGLMMVGSWMAFHKPYPPHRPARPSSLGLKDLFTLSGQSGFIVSADQEEWWSKFELPYRPKVLVNYGTNCVLSMGNRDVVAEAFKKYDFIVSFDIFLNETSSFADIILPDTSYMERLDPKPNFPFIFNLPGGMGKWAWAIRQPFVEPAGERRSFVEVLFEIADRIGLRESFNVATNLYFDLQGKYRLDPAVRYEYSDIVDRVLKDKFGDEHGLEWFKEHGVITWPKNPKEAYWRHFTPVRVPIYFEFFKTVGEQIRQVAAEFSAEDRVKSYFYEALPDWNPCPTHLEQDPSYDLISFYYRDVLHTNSLTMENPWLDEASQMNPYTYSITINSHVAMRKGFKDGDLVWVETKKGRKVSGKLRLSEGIHPEGLGIAACGGHWADGQPIARGKGVRYNDLIEIDWEHMDPISHNVDLCARVRVYKA